MTMHAMSLNALVAGLDSRTETAESPLAPHSVPPTSSCEFEASLAGLLASIEALHRSIAGEEPAPEPARIGKTLALEIQPNPSSAFSVLAVCDGSLGLNHPVEQRARLQKAEQNIQLFAGFVSRDDLSRR